MSSWVSPLCANAGAVRREGPGIDNVEGEGGAITGEARSPDCCS